MSYITINGQVFKAAPFEVKHCIYLLKKNASSTEKDEKNFYGSLLNDSLAKIVRSRHYVNSFHKNNYILDNIKGSFKTAIVNNS